MAKLIDCDNEESVFVNPKMVEKILCRIDKGDLLHPEPYGDVILRTDVMECGDIMLDEDNYELIKKEFNL